MIYYIYDGTFQGLLTAIYEAYYLSKPPEVIVSEDKFIGDLFAEQVQIITDIEKSDKVYQAIEEKISKRSLETVFYCYLSELDGIEIEIYHYLKLGFKLGAKVEERLTDKWVLRMNQVRRKVSFECHRMTGLVRFRELVGGIYYAPIEPDHNILYLLAPHFANRLADQNWIIHDLQRKLAVMFNQQEWVITHFDRPEMMELSKREGEYQRLWQEFFDTIAIKERVNPALQKRFMPVRYWRNLTEKVRDPGR